MTYKNALVRKMKPKGLLFVCEPRVEQQDGDGVTQVPWEPANAINV